jgi:hypothetical protein
MNSVTIDESQQNDRAALIAACAEQHPNHACCWCGAVI